MTTCFYNSLFALTLLAIATGAASTHNHEVTGPEELCISPSDLYHNRSRRAVIRDRARIWDDGIIPYDINENHFNSDEKNAIRNAMKVWMMDTCIQFKERTTEADYIHFSQDNNYCFAGVGKDKGQQIVNIGSVCLKYPGSIVHELGHTLGLWHEHIRPDRDAFIEILWENMRSGSTEAFKIQPLKHLQTFDIEYDYGSIMHYSLFAFSKNGKPTMNPKRAYSGTIGQRDAPSQSDYLKIRYLYGCQKYIPLCSNNGSSDYEDVTLPAKDEDGRSCTYDISPSPSPTKEIKHLLPSESHLFISPSLSSSSSSSFFFSSFYSNTLKDSNSLSPTTISSINPATTDSLPISSTLHNTTMHLMATPQVISLTPTTDDTVMMSTVSALPLCTGYPSSCTLQTAQIMDTTTLLSPTPTSVPWETITSDDKVALKVANANNSVTIHWMSCFPKKCKVKCCDNETEGYPYCPMSFYKLQKVLPESSESSSDIRVGDIIVLRPHDDNQTIITCGKGTCRGQTYCPVLTKKKCRRHHLTIHSLNKRDGETITHNDVIELRFITLPKDYIECNVDNKRCKRYSCHDCSFKPNFIIFKLA